MSLQLNFNVQTSDDCKSLIFTDTTGTILQGSGGYGSPNPAISMNTIATITVVNPAGVTLPIIDAKPTLPNTLGVTFSIPNTQLGLSSTDKITDGLWYFTYDETFVDTEPDPEVTTTATLTQMFLFTCAAECCIEKMLSKIDLSCDCSDNKLNDVVKARTYLSAAIQAALCSKPKQSVALLAQVTYLCNKNSCGC